MKQIINIISICLTNDRSSKIAFFLFAFLYLAYHFFTLPLNPLPWFDETFFASISKSLAASGTLIPEISKEMWNNEECFIYGPIHFLFGSLSFKIFGFGILQYRWITFVFGLFTIIATANLVRQHHLNYKAFLILILIFPFDPFLNLSMHEGRMDLVATFFIITGIDFLLKALKQNQNKLFIWSGFFSVAALLTTPRIGIIFLAMALVFLFSLEGKPLRRSLLQFSLWSLTVIAIYSVWIFYSFGGIGALINSYKTIQDSDLGYLQGRLYIPRHEYLLIFLTILSILYGIYKKGKNYFSPLISISLLSIILFYIIVLDWGPYSAIILPFYYILLFHGFEKFDLNVRSLPAYVIVIIFLFNIGYFSLKTAQIFSEKNNRDFNLADQFIQNNIPSGSKVIGDPQFYYSVIKSGSDYRLYDHYLGLEERERLLKEEFNYDYLIITERSKETDPYVAEYFLSHAKLKKVAVLKTEQSELSKAIAKMGIVSNAEHNGYSAEIYVRIKDERLPMAWRSGMVLQLPTGRDFLPWLVFSD